MLEFRHFEVLRAISREGSLAGAARSLHYSQPTIAHHLATLESHFRVPLVRRGPRGAVLTDVGRVVLPQAEAILGQVAALEDEVHSLVHQGRRTLRVGTFPTAGAQLLPAAVRRLAHGGVKVSLTEGELPAVIEALRNRTVQIALVYAQPGEPLQLGDEFVLQPLLDDPLRIAIPGDHPLAGLDEVPLTGLRDDGWITGASDFDPCDRLLSWACGQAGFQPVSVMRTDDYSLIMGLVAAGIGVALVPQLILTGQETGLAIRPLAHQRLVREISVVMLRTTVSASARLLATALQQQAEQIRARWAAASD